LDFPAYFNVAGVEPGSELGEDPIHTTRAIPRAISAVLGIQGPFPLFGTDHAGADGTAVRDYVHVADVARANIAAARYLTSCGGPSVNTVNIGSGRAHSVRDVLSAVARISGEDVRYCIWDAVWESPRAWLPMQAGRWPFWMAAEVFVPRLSGAIHIRVAGAIAAGFLKVETRSCG